MKGPYGNFSKGNNIHSGVVILAGSGMLTGGRAIHHLKHMVENPNNAVIFVGFQKIYTINRFSSHAGRDDPIYDEFKIPT